MPDEKRLEEMKIVNLIENTEGVGGCVPAHGLSFYMETGSHKLLVDLGPSGETLRNALRLGIDLGRVDTVVLSHGHYDHSGGIMPFTGLNDQAKIYMQKTADREYYADDGEDAKGERFRYIGIDKQIPHLHQIVTVDGDFRIDDELELFTVKHRICEVPFTNRRLLIRNGNDFMKDEFRHEQYLVIKASDRRILVSGCAHNGILNIMNSYLEKYKAAPDVVISGFHLMKKTAYTEDERVIIEEMAKKLTQYPTRFITCHCTGMEAYEAMKRIMGKKLEYVHSGENVKVV